MEQHPRELHLSPEGYQSSACVQVVGPDPGFKHLAGPAPLVKQGRSRVP